MPIEHYDKVWKLLENPERWTQNTFARDVNGWPTPSNERNAVCWDARGGITHVYPNNRIWALNKLEGKVVNIALWNDSHTHAEVLSVLKELDI